MSHEWFDAYGMIVEASSEKGGYTPNGKARIFDTSFTSSQDPDLNSPNENCPTPGSGVGAGGALGEPGANCNPKGEGNLLIIQKESSDTTKPNDNKYGGTLSFLFDKPTEVLKIGLMDLEADSSAYLEIYQDGQSPVKQDIVGLGNNSIQVETVAKKNVKRVALNVPSSFGIRFIELCHANDTPSSRPPPTNRIGSQQEPGILPGKPDFYFSSSFSPCDDSGGMVVNNDRWPSHRFEVTDETIVAREIQGFFSTTQRSYVRKVNSVTIFAAITRMASEKDYPDDANLESRNVVATTTLKIPVPATSATIKSAITAKLEPGWYSLTFGTKSFGATSVPRSRSPVDIRMPNCDHDYHEKEHPFYIYRDRKVFRDKPDLNPRFILTGWLTESCYIGFNNVDVSGDLDIGYVP